MPNVRSLDMMVPKNGERVLFKHFFGTWTLWGNLGAEWVILCHKTP